MTRDSASRSGLTPRSNVSAAMTALSAQQVAATTQASVAASVDAMGRCALVRWASSLAG